MSDLDDLYQEIIIDHGRNPRNRGAVVDPARTANGHNPMCGDKLVLTLALTGDVISDIRFDGQGCAISTASASLMGQAVKGRTIAEAEALFERFHALLAGDAAEDDASLGKLSAFAGVRRFPARVKCATLCWHTLHAALTDPAAPVSTE